VAWNANGGLAGHKGKAARLLALEPDIAVVAECANDVERMGPLARVGWTGTLPRKGLGVFTRKALRARIDPSHDPTRQFFLPIRLDGVAFSLLAVWAMNHRGDEPRPKGGRTHAALGHYARFLADADLVIGDFNDNVRWDRPKRPGFSETTRLLGETRFVNLYHERTHETPGAESAGTLYFRRDRRQPYLIDHAFLRDDRLADVRDFALGAPDEWLDVSDHVPLVLELALPGPTPAGTVSEWDRIGPRVPVASEP